MTLPLSWLVEDAETFIKALLQCPSFCCPSQHTYNAFNPGAPLGSDLTPLYLKVFLQPNSTYSEPNITL